MRHKRIVVEFISPAEQRYSTCGDWQEFEDEIVISVSNDREASEQFLIALHELVEWKLCALRGITQEAVDRFDMQFKGKGEPGDSVLAPYAKQHRFAMLIEHLMAHEMGLTGYGTVE